MSEESKASKKSKPAKQQSASEKSEESEEASKKRAKQQSASEKSEEASKKSEPAKQQSVSEKSEEAAKKSLKTPSEAVIEPVQKSEPAEPVDHSSLMTADYDFTPFNSAGEQEACNFDQDRVAQALEAAPWPVPVERSQRSQGVQVTKASHVSTHASSTNSKPTESEPRAEQHMKMMKCSDSKPPCREASTQTEKDSKSTIRVVEEAHGFRQQPQLSCLKSRRRVNRGPFTHISFSHVRKVDVTNYKDEKDLYGHDCKMVWCEGGCKRRVPKGEGSLMPANFSEFASSRANQMFSVFVCHRCMQPYAEKLLIGPMLPELRAQQMRRLLG